MSALKRGRVDNYDEVRTAREKKTDDELAAGVDLREYLVDEFISGELNNTQVAMIANLHQRNGGSGLESLGMTSSSHNKSGVVKKYIQANSKPLKPFKR